MRFLLALFLSAAAMASAAPPVTVERVPNEGIQPQLLVDQRGTAHLLYYSGDPKSGNLFYTRDERGSWAKPLRVNQRDGSAIAAGTIRGGQLAVGANGRVHAAWNGSSARPNSPHKGVPMYYTRLNEEGTAFEPERDVMQFTGDLDGGGSVAADSQGNVYVAWHGHAPGARPGEAGRAVYLAKSIDHGATFAREVSISPPTGACACCGLKSFADASGVIYILYRGATEVVNRDEILLASHDHGKSFKQLFADPWKVGTCPMSSAAISQSGNRVLAAWETAGQVHLAIVEAGGRISRVAPAGSAGKRKHPVATANKNGDILLVWTEGTGWQRGGAVAWQLFDKSGKPLDERGRKEGVPVWSFAGAYARADGSFVVLY